MPQFRLLFLLLCIALLPGCFTSDTAPTDVIVTAAPAESSADERPATAVPLHPLSIEVLRQTPYPGSELVFEQTLDPGSNYDRYIVSYRSDGLKIYALLTVPRGEQPATGFPVIVFNHGYIPPDEYRTTERYVAYVDAFAAHGYIVFRPDYRGHGFSEGEPVSAYTSPAYVIDVLNAYASVRRHAQADPNRIGMWGHSMGGYITLRAMVVEPGIKAGVIWAGVVASYPDLLRTWFRRGGWRADMTAQYGTPETNPAFWDSLSANSYLSDLSGPVQIHHGTADTTVPYAYSVTLDEQIRAAGRTTELYLYSGDDHNIATNRDGALALSAVFFDRYVKGIYPQ